MSFDTLNSTLSLSIPFSWRAKGERKDGQEDIGELFERCKSEMPERWRSSWYVVVVSRLILILFFFVIEWL